MFVAALLIGFVAGLRTMTAPAAVALARHAPLLGPVFVVAAIGEDVIDKHPRTPSRLAPPSMVLRLLSGGWCGFVLAGPAGLALGAAGTFAGAFLGAAWRRFWADRRAGDLLPALAEDVAAALLAWAAVARLSL